MTEEFSDIEDSFHALVLVIEDDGTTRSITTALLEERGYETLEAGNGYEAMDIIENNVERIDAIVLDRFMPEMDGFELIKRLKHLAGFDAIPVIMATGSAQKDEAREGISADIFYYLVKPFDGDTFQSVIESAVHESKRRRTQKTSSQEKSHGGH